MGLIALFLFICSIGMFIGLINPNVLNKKLKEGEKPWTRKKALLSSIGFLVGCFIFFIILVATSSPSSKATTASTNNPQQVNDTNKKASNDAKAKQEADGKAKAEADAKAKADADAIRQLKSQRFKLHKNKNIKRKLLNFKQNYSLKITNLAQLIRMHRAL